MPRAILLIILLVISFIFSSNIANAQEKAADYQLPYPGILPDNPLYPLKAFRDRVVDFLISDPLKKAEFNILQSDKHLNAGIYLLKKGKPDLAESTISKGENYFEKAMGNIREAKAAKMNTQNIAVKLSSSFAAHKKYLSKLKKDSSRDFKIKFTSLGKRVENFGEQVDSLTR